ncbi:MAG: PstS family phosphate ABC transporter substrate-binding protein [Cytophagales bacterium]|nr:PstS family phosphate ABC transporter substrate-binding protein [Cytophagales bacterium]
MKRLLFVAGLLACFFTHAQKINIKGSDTMLPLVQRLAEEYSKKTKGTEIAVTGGGSGVGITALKDGSTDIAMSSRPIKMSEKLKFEESGKKISETAIAIDPLAVIVNPSNPIVKITKDQLDGIFTGKITNWKEVGGPNLAIIVYTRESSSGTYEYFKEHVLEKKEYTSKALSMPANTAIVQSVGQTPGAIGYVGFVYVNKKVKALPVSFDNKIFVSPTVANAKNNTYPITRSLFFYNANTDDKKLKPLFDYVLSKDGQNFVSSTGFIPIKKY